MRHRAIIFLVFLFLSALLLQGVADPYKPNCGHLKGFIYKSDGKTPLWGAQVILQDPVSENVYRSNVTDSTGDYRLLNVPSGEYRLLIVAREKPYKVKQVDFLVKVFERKTSFLSFALQKSVKPLFFLLEPCCLATIVAGTALGVTIPNLSKEPEASETQPSGQVAKK